MREKGPRKNDGEKEAAKVRELKSLKRSQGEKEQEEERENEPGKLTERKKQRM